MTEILDLAAVNVAKEMMKEKFPTMLEYFVEDSETYIASVRDSIAANSAEKIVSPAHTVKSSSRQMGATKMADIAKELEALARDQYSNSTNDMGPFTELLGKLERAFIETKDAFHQYAT